MFWQRTRCFFRAFTDYSPRSLYGIVSLPFLTQHYSSWAWPKSTERDRPVYFWGSNMHGIADPATYGKEDDVKIPRQLEFWRGKRIVALSLCEEHAAALDDDGNVWQWGKKFWRESGLPEGSQPVCTMKGSNVSRLTANASGVYVIDGTGKVKVLPLDCRSETKVIDCEERILDLHSGVGHLIALTDTGKVMTAALSNFGNAFGQLGRGPTDDTRHTQEQLKRPDLRSIVLGWPRSKSSVERRVIQEREKSDRLLDEIELKPVEDKWWKGDLPVQIASGDYHSLVRTASGQVYAFGSNEMLQLGIGPYDPNKIINTYPVPVFRHLDPEEKITFISASAQTSYYVLDSPTNTTILAAGHGQYGQLGNKTWTHVEGVPTKVHCISGLNYFDEKSRRLSPIRCRYISAGGDHSAAVMNTAYPSQQNDQYGYDVYVWGSNAHCQLGRGWRGNLSEPRTVIPPDPSESDIDYTDMALSVDGPTSVNPEKTISFIGGQFQILPAHGEPCQSIYCGRHVSALF